MGKPVGGFVHGDRPCILTEVLPCGRHGHAASHAGNPCIFELSMSHIDGGEGGSLLPHEGSSSDLGLCLSRAKDTNI